MAECAAIRYAEHVHDRVVQKSAKCHRARIRNFDRNQASSFTMVQKGGAQLQPRESYVRCPVHKHYDDEAASDVFYSQFCQSRVKKLRLQRGFV